MHAPGFRSRDSIRWQCGCVSGEGARAGEVSDPIHAAVVGAAVTITGIETGLKRIAKTDDSGQFNFPQLKPGAYSVKVEAAGFAVQQRDNVAAGLGQKQ